MCLSWHPSCILQCLHDRFFMMASRCVWHFSSQGYGTLGCVGTLPIGTNPKPTWKTFSSAWKFANGEGVQKPLANLSLLPVCSNQLSPVISLAAFQANGPSFWKGILLPKGLIRMFLRPPAAASTTPILSWDILGSKQKEKVKEAGLPRKTHRSELLSHLK